MKLYNTKIKDIYRLTHKYRLRHTIQKLAHRFNHAYEHNENTMATLIIF